MGTDGSAPVRITANAVSDLDAAPSPRQGGSLPTLPVIAVSTNRLTPGCLVGQDASPAELLVWNAGAGALAYGVVSTASWATVSPTNGACAYEQDVLSLSYLTSGLPAGDYPATLLITAAGATNAPLSVTVNLHVKELWEEGFNAWCQDKGLPPGEDGPYSDPDHDGFTTLSEYIADSSPTVSNDFLRIVGITVPASVSIAFEPASTGRVYTLQANTNHLRADAWHDVPGQTRVPGSGGPGSLEDARAMPAQFYRVRADLP